MDTAGDFDEATELWRNRYFPQDSSFEEIGGLIGSNFVENNVIAFDPWGFACGYSAPQELQHARVSSGEESRFTSNNIDPLVNHGTYYQFPNQQAHHAVPETSIPPLRNAYTGDTTSYNFSGAQLGDRGIEEPFRDIGLLSAERKSHAQYTDQVTTHEAHVPQLQAGHTSGTEYQPRIGTCPLSSIVTDSKQSKNTHAQLAPASVKQRKRKKGVNLRKESRSSTPTQSDLYRETSGAVPCAQSSITPRFPAPPLSLSDPDVFPEKAIEIGIPSADYPLQHSEPQLGQIAHECGELDCEAVFDTVAELRHHAKSHVFYCPRQERDPNSCDAKCFSNKRSVDRHLLTHSDPEYHCRRGCRCDFFHRFENRVRHEKTCNGQPSKRSKTHSDADSLAGGAGPAFTAPLSTPQANISSAHAMQRSISDDHPVDYRQQLATTPAYHCNRLHASHTGSLLSSLGTSPGSIVSQSSHVFTNSMLDPTSTPYTPQTFRSIALRTDPGYFSNTGSMQDYSQTPSLQKQ
ncbi:hypothetical protein B0A48_09123 [Cryoendolithus antarcticus]|uniref:C2H2-type domain-containing protein n=1 Tax=Cryoendolithus antarcticus TaxID=1507870 RepID=A0A1V8T1Q2_9PEZI|nr:hypothetical protein B0A48_09123 [Cryoendolithus antarcticus]